MKLSTSSILILDIRLTLHMMKIRVLTNHDATLINGVGCYEKKEKAVLYSVIGREEVDKVVAGIKEVASHAFINVINTDQLDGRFYKAPY